MEHPHEGDGVSSRHLAEMTEHLQDTFIAKRLSVVTRVAIPTGCPQDTLRRDGTPWTHHDGDESFSGHVICKEGGCRDTV